MVEVISGREAEIHPSPGERRATARRRRELGHGAWLLALVALLLAGRDARGQSLLTIDSLASLNADLGALPFEDWLLMERLHEEWWQAIADLRSKTLAPYQWRPPLDPIALEGLRMSAALGQQRQAAEDRFFLALADAMPHRRERVDAVARSHAAHSRLRGALLDGLRPPVLRSISSRAVMTRDERSALEPILAAAEEATRRDGSALAWRLVDRREAFIRSLAPEEIARFASDAAAAAEIHARWDEATRDASSANLDAALRRLEDIDRVVAALPERLRAVVARDALGSFAMRSEHAEVESLERAFARAIDAVGAQSHLVGALEDLRADWRERDLALLRETVLDALPRAARLPLDRPRAPEPGGVNASIDAAMVTRTALSIAVLEELRSCLGAKVSVLDEAGSRPQPAVLLRPKPVTVPETRWQPIAVRGATAPSMPQLRLLCDPGPLERDHAAALVVPIGLTRDESAMAASLLSANAERALLRIAGGPWKQGMQAGPRNDGDRAAAAEASIAQARWLEEIETKAFAALATLVGDETRLARLRLVERVRAIDRSLAPIRTLVEGEIDQRHASSLPSFLVRATGFDARLLESAEFMTALTEETATIAEIAARRSARAEPIAARYGEPERPKAGPEPDLSEDARAAIARWWQDDAADRVAMNEATERLLARVEGICDRPEGIPLRVRWLAFAAPQEFGSSDTLTTRLRTLRRAAATRHVGASEEIARSLDAIAEWLDRSRREHRAAAAARWDAIGLERLLNDDARAEAAAASGSSIEGERAIVEQARRSILVCAPELVAAMALAP